MNRYLYLTEGDHPKDVFRDIGAQLAHLEGQSLLLEMWLDVVEDKQFAERVQFEAGPLRQLLLLALTTTTEEMNELIGTAE